MTKSQQKDDFYRVPPYVPHDPEKRRTNRVYWPMFHAIRALLYPPHPSHTVPSCHTVRTNGSHWDSDWYGLHSHWLVSSIIYPATFSPHSSRVPYTDRVHDGLPHESGQNYR